MIKDDESHWFSFPLVNLGLALHARTWWIDGSVSALRSQKAIGKTIVFDPATLNRKA